MTRKAFIFSTIAITLMAIVMLQGRSAYAGERVGDLVFETMRKIEKRQRTFQKDVGSIRADRDEVIREKEAIKKKYLSASEGSMDEKEAHAEFSYVLAKIYKKTFEEAKLIRTTAKDHLQSLSTLSDGLRNGGVNANPQATKNIIRDTKGFLTTSNSLLLSLGKYREHITDPRINQKLNSAYKTATLLNSYIESLEDSQSNTDTTRTALVQKVEELIVNMEELYIQTGILLDMIRDKTTLLKMVNQIAMSELASIRLTNIQKNMGSSISSEVMDPLKSILHDADNDLGTLTGGMVRDSNSGFNTGQSWVNGLYR